VAEQEHLIIEGVHALCTELKLDEIKEHAIVVPIMVATLDKKVLKSRFIGRSKEQDQRPSSRYVKNIDDIWELQAYLLDVADHGNIPIIHNVKLKAAIREILDLISAQILKRFPPNSKLLLNND
jgi:2-phosphoglycerate kinase